MRQCDKCLFYLKETDELLQEFDDVIKIGDNREKHHCPMFDAQIPDSVYYDGADCEHFIPREEPNEQGR